VVCVDARYLDASFCGRVFDARFVADLPPGVDACGENGEFHTFVTGGPLFQGRIEFMDTDVTSWQGFWFLNIRDYKIIRQQEGV